MLRITLRTMLPALLLANAISSTSAAQSAPEREALIYAGTWTNLPADGLGYAQGIYGFRLGLDSGRLTPIGLVAPAVMPDSLAVSPDGAHLYATRYNGCVCLMGFPFPGAPAAGLVAYRVDAASGALTRIDAVQAHGEVPADIRVSPDGHMLGLANFYSGNLVTYRIEPNGGIGPVTADIAHQGPSVHYPAGAHAHGLSFSADGRSLYLAELGLDQVYRYSIQSTAAALDPAAMRYDAPTGTGPRHLVIHPGGRWLYVANETAGTLTVLEVAGDRLALRQTIALMSEDAEATSAGSAEVALSPDGRFLYANSRSYQGISIFAIDATTGVLTRVDFARTDADLAQGPSTPEQRRQRIELWKHLPTARRVGSGARMFAIDPGGGWLVSANLGESALALFRRDRDTGRLSFASRVAVPNPSAVVFAEPRP